MAVFGKRFQVEIDGASHSEGVMTRIRGCPEGVVFDEEFIQTELTRRAPGQSRLVTQRREADEFILEAGVDDENVATGAEISLWVPNLGQRSADYDRTHNILRPGHGSAMELIRDNAFDQRGGGAASARLTIGHVAAGAVAQLVMDQRLAEPVRTLSYVSRIGHIETDILPTDEASIYDSPVRCPDPLASAAMEILVRQVRHEKDSVGGQVAAIVTGFPGGVGQRPFGSLDGVLAGALMDIHGVKAVEFGDGVQAAGMRGSGHNDAIVGHDGARLFTATNHAGGVLGGVSTGEAIIVKSTFKPTSSIGLSQQTTTLEGEPATLEMKGRHDPCIAIRGVEVVKGVVRMVLVDMLLINGRIHGTN